ncbi:MAG: ABC transporter permease subunit [Streptosporangiales bacterium]|nr:ABC transporter permease subunit [Streptosporangiales bacterium]
MTFTEYLALRWPEIMLRAIQHAEVVLISVAVATLIAVLLAIVVQSRPVLRQLALSLTGTMLTIPSFALFGLLITFLGLGPAPTIVALVLYAIFPILRNAVTGLDSVPAEIIDAARGMGLSRRSLLVTVRVPLAWPVVLNGIRVATIMNIAIAAIAAAVAGPGLGILIFDGLARIGGANALNDTLAGVLGIAVLAVFLDAVFRLVSRLTTSRGIRG